MVFAPRNHKVDVSFFIHQYCSNTEFGTGSTEEVPENMPEKIGLGFVIHAYVDADHAGYF